MKRLNEWKTPDWIKTICIGVMTACVVAILFFSVDVVKSVTSIEKSFAVMASEARNTKEMFKDKVISLSERIEKKASKEGLVNVEKRVDRLEKFVIK